MIRRNFFKGGVGILAAIGSISFLWPKKKEKKTVKMLTQDGKLVEVDLCHVQSGARLASKEEVQTWVWSDRSKPKNK